MPLPLPQNKTLINSSYNSSVEVFSGGAMRILEKECRELIDAQDIQALSAFLDKNPEFNLNDITQNHQSALWYALTPLPNKEPSLEIIQLLCHSKKLDPTLRYAEQHFRRMTAILPRKIFDFLTDYEDNYRRPVAAVQGEQALAADRQNTHDERIVRAIDEAISCLWKRYPAISMIEEINLFQKFIGTLKNKESFDQEKLGNAEAAIARMLTNTTNYAVDKNKKISAGMILALMCHAASDSDPRSFVSGADMTAEGIQERKLLLIDHLAKTQTEYVYPNGKISPACGMGTRNQVVSSLDMIHSDIRVSGTPQLTRDIIGMQYRAFCTEALKKLDPALFNNYLKFYAFRGLPGFFLEESNENIPSSISKWVEEVQRQFSTSIRFENTKNAQKIKGYKLFPEEDTKDKEITIPGLATIFSELFFSLTYNFPALEDSNYSDISTLRRLLEITDSYDANSVMAKLIPAEIVNSQASDFETKTLSEIVSALKKTLENNVDLNALYDYLTTHLVSEPKGEQPDRTKNLNAYGKWKQDSETWENYQKSSSYQLINIIKSLLDSKSEIEKNTILKDSWPIIFKNLLLETNLNPPESVLFNIIENELLSIAPSLSKWLMALSNDTRIMFIRQLTSEDLLLGAAQAQEKILSAALFFSLNTGNLKEFPFQESFEIEKRDLRGVDLSKTNLNKVMLRKCDLRLTGIEHPQFTDDMFLKLLGNDNTLDAVSLPSSMFSDSSVLPKILEKHGVIVNLPARLAKAFNRTELVASFENIQKILSIFNKEKTDEQAIFAVFYSLISHCNFAILYKQIDFLDSLFSEKGFPIKTLCEYSIKNYKEFPVPDVFFHRFPELVICLNSTLISGTGIQLFNQINIFTYDKYLYPETRNLLNEYNQYTKSIKDTSDTHLSIESFSTLEYLNKRATEKIKYAHVIKTSKNISEEASPNELISFIEAVKNPIDLYSLLNHKNLDDAIITALLKNTHVDSELLKALINPKRSEAILMLIYEHANCNNSVISALSSHEPLSDLLFEKIAIKIDLLEPLKIMSQKADSEKKQQAVINRCAILISAKKTVEEGDLKDIDFIRKSLPANSLLSFDVLYQFVFVLQNKSPACHFLDIFNRMLELTTSPEELEKLTSVVVREKEAAVREPHNNQLQQFLLKLCNHAHFTEASAIKLFTLSGTKREDALLLQVYAEIKTKGFTDDFFRKIGGVHCPVEILSKLALDHWGENVFEFFLGHQKKQCYEINMSRLPHSATGPEYIATIASVILKQYQQSKPEDRLAKILLMKKAVINIAKSASGLFTGVLKQLIILEILERYNIKRSTPNYAFFSVSGPHNDGTIAKICVEILSCKSDKEIETILKKRAESLSFYKECIETLHNPPLISSVLMSTLYLRKR